MTATLDLESLLSEAARGKGAILSRRELAGYEQIGVEELRKTLHRMGHHHDNCRGPASQDILGGDEDLGDAPAWIDAGGLYEDLVTALEAQGPVDYVFCLDPWTAQLRSRIQEIAPKARWILISDPPERKDSEHREYTEQLDAWFQTLSFAALLPREALEAPVAVAEQSPAIVHLEKPGAWQWRRILPQATVSRLFLIRYSGSVLHLRLFLDSLARQTAPKGSLSGVLLRGEGGEDPTACLRWFALSQPHMVMTALGLSNEDAWKSELSRILSRHGGATLVLISDHAVLPEDFAKNPPQAAKSVALSAEASAHILTGNLDPLPNYESLLKAFLDQNQESDVDIARVLAPEAWQSGAGDRVDHILRLAQEKTAGPKLPLLHLADLP